MYKTEQNEPLSAVQIERIPNGKYRVILHSNISEEHRTYEDTPYKIYTADETSFFTDERLTYETVMDKFDEYWYLSENGELFSDYLRRKRKPILEAWDILAGNVGVGAIEVAPDRMQELIEWRQALLDLKESAFQNIPDEVNRFMEKKKGVFEE